MSKNDNDLNKDELALLMELLGMAEAELSGVKGAKLGINWLFAHNQHEVRSSKSTKIEKTNSLKLQELISQLPATKNETSKNVNVYVPKFEWEMLPYLDHYLEKFTCLNYANWINFHFADTKTTANTMFALEVVNDEMEPYFRLGDTIIIDSKKTPTNGSNVVAKNNLGQFVLRRISIRGVNKFLVANKSGIETTKVDDASDSIYGVVVGSIRNRK